MFYQSSTKRFAFINMVVANNFHTPTLVYVRTKQLVFEPDNTKKFWMRYINDLNFCANKSPSPKRGRDNWLCICNTNAKCTSWNWSNTISTRNGTSQFAMTT